MVDVPVNAARGFEFKNLECGVYMLVVMGAKGCLSTQILKVSAAIGRVARVELKVAETNDNSCTSLKP